MLHCAARHCTALHSWLPAADPLLVATAAVRMPSLVSCGREFHWDCCRAFHNKPGSLHIQHTMTPSLFQCFFLIATHSTVGQAVSFLVTVQRRPLNIQPLSPSAKPIPSRPHRLESVPSTAQRRRVCNQRHDLLVTLHFPGDMLCC